MGESAISTSSAHLELSSQLPISTDSTTSRVVVNNDALRTVLFTFDTGQELTEHASPKAVVVTLLEGTMDFEMLGNTYQMVAGDVIYLAPNEPHALKATSPARLHLVMVTPPESDTC